MTATATTTKKTTRRTGIVIGLPNKTKKNPWTPHPPLFSFVCVLLLCVTLFCDGCRGFTPSSASSSSSNSRNTVTSSGKCPSSIFKQQRLYYQNSNENDDTNDQQQRKDINSSSSSSDDAQHDDRTSPPRLERLTVAGVSISSEPPGFFVLLQRAANASSSASSLLPLPITLDPQDATATTSPESLTLIQLLSNVDMAGAILPPETLAKLVVLSCESTLFLEDPQRHVLEAVHKSLQTAKESYRGASSSSSTAPSDGQEEVPGQEQEDPANLSYADAPSWLQSRITLPQVTLDELVLTYIGGSSKGDGEEEIHDDDLLRASLSSPSSYWQCTLHCKVQGVKGTIAVRGTPDLIQAVSYNYDKRGSSTLFTCMALALRYKAPILLLENELEEEREDSTCTTRSKSIPFVPNAEALDDLFPQRTTVAKLQRSNTRVTQNIERGFEIHKLTKALQMARRLGDAQAETKIRAALDKMDSFQELPVVTTTATPTTSNTPEDDDQDEETTTPLSSSSSSFEEDDPTSFQ